MPVKFSIESFSRISRHTRARTHTAKRGFFQLFFQRHMKRFCLPFSHKTVLSSIFTCLHFLHHFLTVTASLVLSWTRLQIIHAHPRKSVHKFSRSALLKRDPGPRGVMRWIFLLTKVRPRYFPGLNEPCFLSCSSRYLRYLVLLPFFHWRFFSYLTHRPIVCACVTFFWRYWAECKQTKCSFDYQSILRELLEVVLVQSLLSHADLTTMRRSSRDFFSVCQTVTDLSYWKYCVCVLSDQGALLEISGSSATVILYLFVF